jgi:hypothetical protein
MTSYAIGSHEVAVYNKTLVAATVDTVTIDRDCSQVRVVNDDGADVIYFTVDKSTPTVAGNHTYRVVAAANAAATVSVPDRWRHRGEAHLRWYAEVQRGRARCNNDDLPRRRQHRLARCPQLVELAVFDVDAAVGTEAHAFPVVLDMFGEQSIDCTGEAVCTAGG